MNEFELFLNRLPNLQVLVHLRPNYKNPRPEIVADCLYQRFPQLNGFGCNVDDVGQQSVHIIGNKLKFLEKFTQMTDIYVGCYDAEKPRDIHQIIQYVP